MTPFTKRVTNAAIVSLLTFLSAVAAGALLTSDSGQNLSSQTEKMAATLIGGTTNSSASATACPTPVWYPSDLPLYPDAIDIRIEGQKSESKSTSAYNSVERQQPDKGTIY